jgi:U32 family peptidase
MHKTKPRLLAPVGSLECLTAAIEAGADAIYFGVEQLNMRVKSVPCIGIEDIPEIANTCHKHQVKAYITLNTTVFDHDHHLLKEIIKVCVFSKIDAAIACDFAVISACLEAGLPIHISTQANVTNIETVKFYSKFADLIVLSRELTLKQIEAIIREIKHQDIKGPSGHRLQIEVFVHGALCMAVSGKCYLSLHSNNSSANRGACVQNCRHTYLVSDKDSGVEYEIDNEYIMSAKDLCTIDFLDKIIAAGVNVLKIEGRARSADYVHTTVSCYKQAIQAIEDKTFSPQKIKYWKEELATVFNRGFWEGYYLGKLTGEWSETGESKATQKKIYLAKAEKYYSRTGIAEFKLETGQLNIGDEVLVIGPTTGVKTETVLSLYVDGKPSEKAVRGDLFTIPFPHKLRPSDKLYKLVKTVYAQNSSVQG